MSCSLSSHWLQCISPNFLVYFSSHAQPISCLEYSDRQKWRMCLHLLSRYRMHPRIQWTEIATVSPSFHGRKLRNFRSLDVSKKLHVLPTAYYWSASVASTPTPRLPRHIWERHIFLDRTLDFGFIIFTILSTTPRNKDAAESAQPTVAPFLAATRSVARHGAHGR